MKIKDGFKDKIIIGYIDSMGISNTLTGYGSESGDLTPPINVTLNRDKNILWPSIVVSVETVEQAASIEIIIYAGKETNELTIRPPDTDTEYCFTIGQISQSCKSSKESIKSFFCKLFGCGTFGGSVINDGTTVTIGQPPG